MPLPRLRLLCVLALVACASSSTVPAVGGSFAFTTDASAQAADTLTPHEVATLRMVSSAEISPDGKHAAYVLVVPRKPMVDDDGAPWTELHVMDLEDGRSRPFVTGKGNVGSVRWTPDGKSIAFLAKRGDDKFTSLYLLPVDGGEARRAASLSSSIAAYSFAPDGKRVALVGTEPDAEARKKTQDKGFKQEIYEEDGKHKRLFVARLFDEEAKPKALPIEGSIHQVHWSPADERIMVSVTPTYLVDDEYVRQRVRIVDPGSGEVLAKIENPGKLGDLAWSPDGKRIALVCAADEHDPSAGRLSICSSEGGTPVDLVPNHLGDFASVAWQDANTILFLGSESVWSSFGRVGADGKGFKRIAPKEGPILTSFSFTKDGQKGVFVGSTPEHPHEMFTMAHGDSAPKRRTFSNPVLEGKRLARQEVIKWKARDGLELEGVIVRPLGEERVKTYPLILYVHGGPEAHESNGWQTAYSKPGQIAAARGIATFYPNYRGSTGRGVAFSKLSQGDPAGKEFDDLVDAVDHLVAIGLADKDKVGITGGSYGGYATGWCTTRYSDRFAAGVMFVGISDKVSKVGTTDIANEEYMVHALERPWENWQKMLERSPIYHAGNARTPLLILHGKDDPRVDPGQSRELYRHLKLRGKAPVRLVLYPGEGHGNRKAAARLDYNLRMLQWMEHYLVGPGGEMPAYEIDYAEPKEKKEAVEAAAGTK